MPGDDYTKKILRVSQTFLQIVKSFPYLARFCNFYRSVGLDSCALCLIALDGVHLTRTEHATRGARRKNRFLRAGQDSGSNGLAIFSKNIPRRDALAGESTPRRRVPGLSIYALGAPRRFTRMGRGCKSRKK
jgi:hypothetical protein